MMIPTKWRGDNPLTINAEAGVLSNDVGTGLTAQLVDTTSNGTLQFATDGSFTYAPTVGFEGADTFTYFSMEGDLNSEPATVTINVQAINIAPVANNDALETDEDIVLVISTTDLTQNDVDESEALTTQLLSFPSDGVLTIEEDGFTYTPNENFSGTDSFGYQVNDGEFASTPATVTITVNPVDDAPIAGNDTFEVIESGETVDRCRQRSFGQRQRTSIRKR